MKKKGYALLICLLIIVMITSAASAVYLPSKLRPMPPPAGKPVMVYPFTDPAVKLVSGYGTDTHNDDTFTTHTYFGTDYMKNGGETFTIVAPAAGKLTYASWTASLPNVAVEKRQAGCDEDIDPVKAGSQARTAIIDHGNGWKSIYMHLGSYLVPDGKDVIQGEPIGVAGCSGAYWVHLHFELRHYGDTVWSYDPGFTGLGEVAGPSLDIVFLLDTTGSMWDDIDSMKSAATSIINKIAVKNPNARIAVMDYRDFPDRGASYDYPYNDVLPFTYDRNAAVAAIQSLGLGYGGDTPETANCAIMHAIANSNCAGRGAATTLGPWASSNKAIIVMTDAPALDPEPYTGYTTIQVMQELATGKFDFSLYGGGEDDYGGSAPMPSGVAVYPVVIGGNPDALDQFQQMANASGGKLFESPDADGAVDAILEAIEIITKPPTIYLPMISH